MNRLVTIPFSHYCEKARWALDACGVAFEEDKHLPLFHWIPARRAGGGRTVPVLVRDGDRPITDSTEIVAWADTQAPGTLLPADAGARAEALALEDDFDRHLGPATRRWAYFHLLPRKDLMDIVTADVSRWQATAFRIARPLATRILARGLKIDAVGAARSQVKIEEAFARVGTLLADGRRFLTGDAFSVADLTFAALATPVLMPSQLPAALPAVTDFRGEARELVEAWRASPAGAFALRLYAEHR